MWEESVKELRGRKYLFKNINEALQTWEHDNELLQMGRNTEGRLHMRIEMMMTKYPSEVKEEDNKLTNEKKWGLRKIKVIQDTMGL